MWVNANIHLRIGAHFRQVHHLLPEGAAKHCRLSGAHHAESQAAELDIAAAHHHRRSRPQTALRRRRVGDCAEYGAGLFYRRENIGPQSGHIQQRRTPVAAEQVEHAGGPGVRGVDRQLAGKLRRQPVADHGDGRRAAVNIRAMMGQPQQARHGA